MALRVPPAFYRETMVSVSYGSAPVVKEKRSSAHSARQAMSASLPLDSVTCLLAGEGTSEPEWGPTEPTWAGLPSGPRGLEDNGVLWQSLSGYGGIHRRLCSGRVAAARRSAVRSGNPELAWPLSKTGLGWWSHASFGPCPSSQGGLSSARLVACACMWAVAGRFLLMRRCVSAASIDKRGGG